MKAAILRNRGPLLLGAVMFALAGCGGSPETGFRQQGAPVSSTTRVDPARLAGEWQMVARFAADPAADARLPESYEIGAAGPEGFTLRHRITPCAGCAAQSEQISAHLSGPGRFTMLRNGETTEHWVHWIDEGHRMAAIGTPKGRFGWIMAREGFEDRSDLIKAAKDVLEWQGYDMARLVEVRR